MEVHKPKFVKGFVEEILVILISISLALLAERTVEQYHNHHEAKGVARRMVEELRRDSTDLAFNTKMHTWALDAENALTQWSRRERELPPDSLVAYASRSLIFTYFASNTTEIEGLKGSGKLYLIENPKVLSDLLRHYDRYDDFKLFTDQARAYSALIAAIYRPNAQLRMQLDNKHVDQLFHYSAQDLERHLRGNSQFENLLQEKTWIDWWIVNQSTSATKRLNTLIATLRSEE